MFFLKIIDDQDQELELTKNDYRSPIPKKYQLRTWAADPEGITGEELLAFNPHRSFHLTADAGGSYGIDLSLVSHWLATATRSVIGGILIVTGNS